MTLARSLLCGLLALAVPMVGVRTTLAAPDASPDDRRQAKRAFDRGQKQFSLGRFEEALASYEAAYEAFPLPGILFNIGQSHRNLGNLDEAIFSFKKYLHLVPDADNREAVESLVRDLDRERRRLAGDSLLPPDAPRVAAAPFYRRWWFWTGVAVVAGSTAAIVLTADPGDSLPESDLGNISFP